MRDINQKASDIDKQIAIALRRSVWLSYLLSLGAISTGGLSIFTVAALLGTKPAQANMTEPSGSLPNQVVEEEQASETSSLSSEFNAQTGFHPVLAQEESNGTALGDVPANPDISSNQPTSLTQNLKASDAVVPGRDSDAPKSALTFKVDDHSSISVTPSNFQALSTKEDAAPELTQSQPEQAVLAPTQPLSERISAFTPKSAIAVGAGLVVTPGIELSGTNTKPARTIPEIENDGTDTKPASTQYNFAPSAIETENFSSLSPQPSTEEGAIAAPTANSLSFALGRTTTLKSNPLAQVSQEEQLATVLPGFTSFSTQEAPTQKAVEDRVPEAQSTEFEKPTTILPGFSLGTTALLPTVDEVDYKVWDPSVTGKQPKAILPPFAYKADASAQSENPAQPSVPKSMAEVAQPTMIVAQATSPDATATEPAPYSGPGAARLLGGTIQAQSSLDATQEAQSENAAQTNNPLAPSLTFQGGFITQGETGARARLTGLYPVSPNLLFGGTLDLTTGEGFSDTEGTGLDITELYFTASLPSYPNLRLTGGLVDLTSYFDRNSFAKDSLTHFFNPVFQTNPALARTGLGSRPAALLNWDITDNFQARAAAFSSSRNLGELAVDGFAGELAYRFHNGIIRATYATDRDDQRNGFEEIYGIARSNGELGPRTSDRESSYGINVEYYIPEFKMGLFGRYGHYENTSIGRGGETYSMGFNFLDLFMKDDRLGLGYGRDLSNDTLRRANGNKRPDVWEAFYDFRVTPYLRAGVTLQARDEFSDIVAGFRVKTEFDLLGRLLK